MGIIADYIRNFWQVFSSMAPWLLMGYFLAGIIAYFLKPEQVKKHLGGQGIFSVLKAVLIGVPLPICSCGVIPIAAALRQEGAGKGATGAFFISTPQTGIDSIVVTASMMGWIIAVIRPVVAFLSGLTGGLLISKFCPALVEEKQEPPQAHHCCCCHSKGESEERNWKKAPLFILSYGFIRMMKSTAPSLLVGMAVAALIQQLVPENFGAEYLCGNTALEFLVVLIFSIPLYICSSASVPVALALILKGFSPGAALLFLIAGPTIHSVSITSMRQIIGEKAMLLAVGAIAFWAVISGVIVNMLDITIPQELVTAASSGRGTLKTVCGILLIGVGLLMMTGLLGRMLTLLN